MRSMAEIDHPTEHAVTKPAQPRDVTAAAARGEPCSLCEVRAAQKRIHELRDLARSAEPSASTMAMTSPVAASNPQASAFPFPRRVCCTTRTSGRSRRATAIVSSTECPSTTITSWTSAGSRAKTYGRFLASFNVGTTTDTRGQVVMVGPRPHEDIDGRVRTAYAGESTPGARDPARRLPAGLERLFRWLRLGEGICYAGLRSRAIKRGRADPPGCRPHARGPSG